MEISWNVITQTMRGQLTGSPAIPCTGVSTDSRSVKNGQIYFALTGERFDGHEFAASAIARGAAAVVTVKNRCTDVVPRIEVDDPLFALQELAGYYRQKHDIPVIAITGSHGKTTTKDILAAILETGWKTLMTYQNLNGMIGVPLTLLKLEPEHQALVIEVGISIPGEMKRLASIVSPTLAIMTCIAQAHSQFMPTLTDIFNEKRQLLEHLKPGGPAIVNADDPVIMHGCRHPSMITFGLEAGDFRAHIVRTGLDGTEFEVDGPDGFNSIFNMPSHGRHNVLNALAAITTARILGFTSDQIRKGLTAFAPSPHRTHIIRKKSLIIIDDSYNAAPFSMRCALGLLAELPGPGRRIAVLGDMLELGDDSIGAHKSLGEAFADYGIDELVAFGPCMEYMCEVVQRHGIKVHYFPDNLATARSILEIIKPGDLLLVKASRSMHAEVVVERLVDG